MRKTLYEIQKGKQMRASGSWKVTRREQMLIYAVSAFFAVSVIAVLASSFAPGHPFLTVAVICCAVAFVSMFAVMFGLVFRKSREEPMETHYYDVDYEYNAFTGQTRDETREITKEEFLHGRDEQVSAPEGSKSQHRLPEDTDRTDTA